MGAISRVIVLNLFAEIKVGSIIAFCYNEPMIKIEGNDILRGGEKIGWIEGNDVRAHDGKKLGYFEGNHVYNSLGERVAYINGDHLFSQGGSEMKMHLEKINEEIVGGVLPEIGKCAIYVLLD